MRKKNLYLRNLNVRDNSGANTRQLISARPKALSKQGILSPLSRVISSTKRVTQVRKGIQQGKVTKVLVVNTRAPMKGWNGILRWSPRTHRVLLKEGGNLRGTRLRTKLPKCLFGKGRSLRSRNERLGA